MDVPSESSLEEAERHIRLGEEHITKQTALIAELEKDGRHDMLPAAREFLETLKESQAAHLEHAEVQRRMVKEKGGD